MRPQFHRTTTRTALAALAMIAAGCTHHAPPAVAAAPVAAKHTTAWEDSVALAEMAADARAAEAKKLAAAKAEADAKALLARKTYFNFDQAVLADSDKARLDAKIPILEQNPALKIQIAGNCDDRGSDEYNLALGQERAAAAKRYLVDHGVAADRIEIVSFGKERPVANGTDDASRAQNRNDQFLIIAGAEELGAGPH